MISAAAGEMCSLILWTSHADKLVATVMQRLAEGFATERSNLEKQWGPGRQRIHGGSACCAAALPQLL
jgi:hypothetical protein